MCFVVFILLTIVTLGHKLFSFLLARLENLLRFGIAFNLKVMHDIFLVRIHCFIVNVQFIRDFQLVKSKTQGMNDL
jgi:hypothetical protein